MKANTGFWQKHHILNWHSCNVIVQHLEESENYAELTAAHQVLSFPSKYESQIYFIVIHN